MKDAFLCSLCRDGILGGALYLDSRSVTYRTQKLTVRKEYRNLTLPLHEIARITWKWTVFPVAAFWMKSGECYQFILFNKRRFQKRLRECLENPVR